MKTFLVKSITEISKDIVSVGGDHFIRRLVLFEHICIKKSAVTKLDRSENWKKGENMSLSGIVSIGNIGINAVYVYLGMMLLCTAAVYYIVKKIYKWAIKKQMLRFMSYIGASTIIISLTVILAVLQERNAWQFLKAAMQSLAFLGISLAVLPLLHQFLLKRK